ncbi:MAG: hypothetical protein JST59_01695 [Actinobacteria bacterium]|nr:hypothetical protein [Actinomycetota bacterium]
MTDNSDSKRPGTIVKPTGMISSKVIESRSKSYSDLSSKQHLKSHIEEESCSQEGFYAVGWGRNRFNEYPQADWNIPVVEVACGEKHSVLLTNRFELFACGDNQHGQLGLPTSTYACTS